METKGGKCFEPAIDKSGRGHKSGRWFENHVELSVGLFRRLCNYGERIDMIKSPDAARGSQKGAVSETSGPLLA